MYFSYLLNENRIVNFMQKYQMKNRERRINCFYFLNEGKLWNLVNKEDDIIYFFNQEIWK